jgi:hypothetical protein
MARKLEVFDSSLEPAAYLAESLSEITCVGCGCTDSRPCPEGCYWIAMEEAAGRGICSQCAATPVDALLKFLEA